MGVAVIGRKETEQVGRFGSILVPRADKHHLWWIKDHYKPGTEKDFRALRCQQAVLDGAVHRTLHSLYAPPTKPTEDMMKSAIRRHDRRQCSCFSSESEARLEVILPLREEHWTECDYNLPVCFLARLDRVARQMMDDLYRKPKLLTMVEFRLLLERHEAGECGCLSQKRGAVVPPDTIVADLAVAV